MAKTRTKARAKRPTRKASAAAKARRYVYSFGGGKADGRADMKNLLGGKGANLAEMARLGLPVPSKVNVESHRLLVLLPIC